MLAAFALLVGVFGVAANQKESIVAEAVGTSSDVRIAVVRPMFWGEVGARQVLRVANSAEILTLNTIASITYFDFGNYVGDTYYNGETAGGFTEYNADGVMFLDIPLASLTGKFFDLARLSTLDPETATVWNRTGAEQFNPNMLHKIWRIYGDGSGIFRPDGATPESRNVSNPVVSSLLYGYLSCSSSTENGYGAFDALNNNFNLVGRTFAETDTVLDFAVESDYPDGRGDGVIVLTSAKIAMMQTMYNAANLGSGSRLTPIDFKRNLALLTLTGTLSLTALAGFYFLKTKKQ